MLKCDSNSDLLALGGERIEVRWGKIFELKSPGGQPKYPLLSRLVKCLLCLPHGNADCERGFSENKHFYENRYSLCIASINGLRQTKTYLRRYDGDATKVPLSTELLQSVRRSRARYTERTASAQQSESRKRLGYQDTGADVDEKRLRKNLEEKAPKGRIPVSMNHPGSGCLLESYASYLGNFQANSASTLRQEEWCDFDHNLNGCSCKPRKWSL
ncbi:hypothetical protein HPB51_026239 [Rhipicephalus microplus]|uniref:HAT C-terminal dimerisation domain-containing protein n=1 Tax=Rhipicephalus microplus TaxID=6941 RepID=A0A9J6DYT8_RHIMP|nr:hypothetical protein HPB51_026239 [Rhipicephalus microplus]